MCGKHAGRCLVSFIISICGGIGHICCRSCSLGPEGVRGGAFVFSLPWDFGLAAVEASMWRCSL